MRFTVLGSSGFIGSHLVTHLRGLGHEVLTPGRDELHSLSEPLGHAIYAIGLTADFRNKSFETVRAHVTVLANLLENARFDSLTYLSSTRVYSGASSGRWDAAISVRSTDGSDLYNLSKLMGESLCLNTGRQGVKVVRLSNVVGAGDPHSANFLFSLIKEAQAGCINLQSDPRSSKDYIHLDDVVEMLTRIASMGRRNTYNLASGMNLTHAAWVEALHGLTGCQINYPQEKAPVIFPPIDISALKSEFHFTPRLVLDILPDLLY